MGTRHNYSAEFKNAVVTKILNRGNLTIQEVCEKEGVFHGTVRNWIHSRANVGDSPKTKRGRRMKWSAEAKLKAVIETESLAEYELGTYIRREGLYTTQLSEWRAEIIERLEAKSPFAKDERDEKIKNLERDLLRKDRALAEASALLILQKKVNLIWDKYDSEQK